MYGLMLAERLQGVASEKLEGRLGGRGCWGARGAESGEGGEAGEAVKFREIRGVWVSRALSSSRCCVQLGPWAQGSSQASFAVILAQGVLGGARNLHFKHESMDRRQRSTLIKVLTPVGMQLVQGEGEDGPYRGQR